MDTPADVVGRVAALLKAVGDPQPGGSTTSQLARRVGLPRATVHRLLSSLAEEGLLDRDRESGRWLLGPELYVLGMAAQSRFNVANLAQPAVRRLSLATGESAYFSARRGDETVCLLGEDGSFPLRSHVLHEGIRFPLGVASAGLVILSFLPEPEIESYLRRTDLTEAYGPEHAPTPLRRRIAEVRSVGWSVNPGLLVEGSWGMGAAVFDQAGRPQWALSVTGVASRFDATRRREVGAVLLREAHWLTQQLRTHPEPSPRPGR